MHSFKSLLCLNVAEITLTYILMSWVLAFNSDIQGQGDTDATALHGASAHNQPDSTFLTTYVELQTKVHFHCIAELLPGSYFTNNTYSSYVCMLF